MSLAASSNIARLPGYAGLANTAVAIRRAYKDMLPGHDPALRHVAQLLKQSEALLPDWDDEDGQPPSAKATDLAKDIIENYAANTQITNRRWIRPSVGVLNDGSVTVYWKVSTGQVYLTIPQAAQSVLVTSKRNGFDARSSVFPIDRTSDLIDGIVRFCN